MVEVPLTQDILGNKPDFVKTRAESLLSVGTLITRATQRGSDGTTIVYVVPPNRTLFIIALSLNGHNSDDTSTGIATATIDTSAQNNRLLQLEIGFAHDTGLFTGAVQNSVAHTFTIPLKLQAGQSILLQLSGGSSLIAVLCFQGYEVPKEIII